MKTRVLVAVSAALVVLRILLAPAQAQGPEGAAPTPVDLPPSPDAGTADGGVPSADDPAPYGHAAPPTEAARTAIHGSAVRVGLEVFGQYAYQNRKSGGDRSWFHVFDIPRAQAAIDGRWERARGRVVLEATRSASEGSLIGVAGDSLVLRIREAWASYTPHLSDALERAGGGLELSAGVIPTLTVPELDGTWMLRPIAPSGLEANGLLSPADVGAKARFDLPKGYGWIATAAYNGEGYTNRELNRGKNVETAIELHPLAAIKEALPLGLFASYVAGSSTTAVARADRVTAGALWQGGRLRAGATFTYAWGFAEFGQQRALLATAFVRGEPIPRVLLGLRYDHVVRDTNADERNAFSTIWGTAGYRLALPLETFLALTRTIPTTRAEAEIPGSNTWELRAIARVVF